MRNNLVYASPESLGIPSRAISDFIDEMRELRLPIHSVLFMRHGKVAAEGYCKPFDENRKHRLYSCSKSFTSVGIGMLTDAGKLSLDDRLVDIFPEYVPENPSPFILEATVRHLLMMATFNETNAYDDDSPDFVRAFFDNKQDKHKPGTVFHYDTAATVTLCGIIEKLSGKSFVDFMRPLFDELGISEDAKCVKTTEGRCWTGSGMLLTTRDFARFGQFCLNRGMFNDKQLVSREYMLAATSHQIDTTVGEGDLGGPMGYGYQFWMLNDGGFACLGMGSQFAYMTPKYDTVMIITADTQSFGAAGDAIRFAHYRLLKKLSDKPLAEDACAQGELKERLDSLFIPLPVGVKTTPLAGEFSGTKYVFEDNRFGFVWMRANVSDDLVTLEYENKTGEHKIDIFMGEYKHFRFPEKYYGAQIGVRDSNYDCISAGAWTTNDTLLGIVYSVDDHIGTLKMQLTFSKDELTVFMTKAAEWFFDDYRGYLAGHAV